MQAGSMFPGLSKARRDTGAAPWPRLVVSDAAGAEAIRSSVSSEDLGEHLVRLCEALQSSARRVGTAELSVGTFGDCHVPAQSLAPIGLIVREAISNAVKYAHPAGVLGRIVVECRRNGDWVLIDITDDGVGLPEGFDPALDGGLGFELMRSLTGQIGGVINFVSTGLGLRVSLRAPVRSRDARVAAPDDWEDEGRRLAGLLEALPVAVYTTDTAGRITFYNQAAVALWGRRPEAGDAWCGSWRLYRPDGRPMPHSDCAMAETVRENRPVGGEAISERRDGVRAAFMAYAAPLHDTAGRLVGAINTLVDIAERKRAEERQTLLAREIHHRTKNLLTVVQSIVTRGLDGARPVKESRAVVLDRLAALAATYDNLITTSWEGVEFGEIVRRELGPFPGQLEIDGPPLLLNPQSAQSLTLAMHELATNAAKYGALSAPAGKVSIRWAVTGADGAQRFDLLWRESGGPPVVHPQRKGFGTMVLERVVAQDFDSRPRIDFDPVGLTYALNLPLDAVIAAPSGGVASPGLAG